ncbi:hypothetical protein SUGI_0084340 [Cryptomeria japonica]|nr:hypothetical protein SUGI_0084340 [Cryptomeria japonica]
MPSRRISDSAFERSCVRKFVLYECRVHFLKITAMFGIGTFVDEVIGSYTLHCQDTRQGLSLDFPSIAF